MERTFRWCALFCIALSSAAVLSAQPPIPGDATVGVPYTLDFGQGLRDIPSTPDVAVVFTFAVVSGTLPPGLSLKSDGLLSGVPTTPGQFNFSIRFTFSVSAGGQTFSSGGDPFPFGILVKAGTGPQVSVDPRGLSFSVVTGSAPSSLVLTINNLGPLPRAFSTTASTTVGGAWLSASNGGSAPAFGQGSVTVTATPGQLAAGTYIGIVSIVFTPGTERFDVPVILAINSNAQSIGISQSGLSFRAVSGGGAPPSQSFSVFNVGTGALNFTATTSTLAGGDAWLTATPATGRSDATTAPVVQVTVRPAGLAPGDYYGQVRIAAPDIANSPQSVSVVLTVLPATVAAAPVVLPTGLIFVGQAGGANPALQNVDITNLTARPANFSTTLSFDQGKDWFTATPKTGVVMPNQPGRIAVQPLLAGLAVGVYRGQLAIRFIEDGSTRRIDVLLVVIPRPGAGAFKMESAGRFADGCTPTKLYPVFTQLGSSFTTTAAWPTALELRVIDDCGTSMTSGSVIATFSSGDPAVSLSSLRDGRWTGTWQPRAQSSAPVTITANAQIVAPPIRGTASIGGSLQPNTSTPVINAGGAVNAVSLAPLAPLAAGGLVRITGSNLAQGSTIAAELPLKSEINGTQVLLAGRPLPMMFASNGQINAIVPFDVPINTTHQMIVRRDTSYSVPEPVTVAGVQPAVYTKDETGKGLALIAATKADGTQFVVDADNPVSEGDTIVISCAGLGPVDPPVDAGVAAPAEPLSNTVNSITVTIGGQPATVISSVLAPEMTGIYQVTVTVPAGITPAPDAPLVVTVADQPSPVVTIPVQ